MSVFFSLVVGFACQSSLIRHPWIYWFEDFWAYASND
jgi:hypothetical protein